MQDTDMTASDATKARCVQGVVITRMGRDSKLTPHIVVQATDYAARWRNSRHLSRVATRPLRVQIHYYHLWLEARHPQQQWGYHWPWLLGSRCRLPWGWRSCRLRLRWHLQ